MTDTAIADRLSAIEARLPAAPAPKQPAEYNPSRGPMSAGSFSAEQTAAFAETLLANGVDPKRVASAAGESGLTLPPADDRSPDLKAFEGFFGEAATDLADYKVDWSGRGSGDIAADLEMDTSARTWLSGLGFAKGAGSIVERIIDVQNRVAGMSATERQSWSDDQTRTLFHVSKGDAAAAKERVDVAAQMIASAPAGKFGDQVRANRALLLSSAEIVLGLFNAGQLLVARSDLRK